MPIFFDGHNDSLTREDHADFATGREGGHLDLPRMEAAGMRGGIFAVFIRNPETADYRPEAVEPPGRCRARPRRWTTPTRPPRRPRRRGGCFAMERAGQVRVGRTVADLDAAAEGGPPVTVLHLEGAEAIDAELESLELWYAAGLRSLGPVWSRPNGSATASASSSPRPRTWDRASPTRARTWCAAAPSSGSSSTSPT